MGADVKLIRAYTPEDYEIVRGWWGERAVHPSALTANGVFGLIDGKEAACAWLYCDNRSRVATVENIVIDPAFNGPGNPFDHIFGFFGQQAAEIGKEMVIEKPFDNAVTEIVCPNDTFDTLADRVEAMISELGENNPSTVTHRFTPGLYAREIFIPAFTFLTSKIHGTEHPFVISKGDVSVVSEQWGRVRLKAPFTGITEPGTRRILFTHADTIWTTFHAGPWKTVEEFEEAIIVKRVNPLLEEARKCLGGE